MKIAIKGHPTKGKEVIQILESLGGRKTLLIITETLYEPLILLKWIIVFMDFVLIVLK